MRKEGSGRPLGKRPCKLTQSEWVLRDVPGLGWQL